MKSHKIAILRMLEKHGDSLSTKQIRGALGLNKAATAKLKAELQKLIKTGKIAKQGTRYLKADEKNRFAVSREKRKEIKKVYFFKIKMNNWKKCSFFKGKYFSIEKCFKNVFIITILID